MIAGLKKASQAEEFIPTRSSLISRLKDWGDSESWTAFFNVYWKLIYATALRTGLNDQEAQDVVQDTVMTVCKAMPTFRYDRTQSFKGWLMVITKRRIYDHFRKAQRDVGQQASRDAAFLDTKDVGEIPDPAFSGLEEFWEKDWEENLMRAALERVRNSVDPRHFQLFELYVLQDWPMEKICKTLNVSATRVYVAKHRITAAIRKQIRWLEKHDF